MLFDKSVLSAALLLATAAQAAPAPSPVQQDGAGALVARVAAPAPDSTNFDPFPNNKRVAAPAPEPSGRAEIPNDKRVAAPEQSGRAEVPNDKRVAAPEPRETDTTTAPEPPR